MALPVILVNSATGSDSAASGAGPSTALTGSAASTDGAGTLVTLDGSPDLTNVATDGSHVIYLADATAGNRNFGKIIAKDNGAKTVTVSDAFGISLSGKSWAIGGKRASIGGTNSKKLFDNNGAAGDAMPGWIVEMGSGHSETIAATLDIWRSGNTTDGSITLMGETGAATKPIVTFSNNGNCLTPRGNAIHLLDFELRNSNATKTASVAILPVGTNCLCKGLKIAHSTDKFWKGFATTVGGADGGVICNCEIGYCANIGIDDTQLRKPIIFGNSIHDCGSHGIAISGDILGALIVFNVCWTNGGDGIRITGGSSGNRSFNLLGNTCDANTGDGIEITIGTGTAIRVAAILNNQLTNNGGYGLNLSGSVTAAIIAFETMQIANNNTFSNTSGAYNPSGAGSNDPATNPNYVNASGGDFTPQEATLEGTAFPTSINGISSFGWPGAIQPEDVGSPPQISGDEGGIIYSHSVRW